MWLAGKLVAVVALVLAGTAAAAPPKAGVLVPGRSLGGVSPGMTEAQVRDAWGSRFGICRDCRGRMTWYFNRERFHPQGAGVELRGDASVRAIDPSVAEAGEADWAEEYLALVLAVKVVGSAEEAIAHVNAYGSGHSEAILTRDTASARAFQLGVDAACVYVNVSTRFTDGGEFGMGAEIGNSTQKLHARGPIGARELCTFKYLVEGDGQIRG